MNDALLSPRQVARALQFTTPRPVYRLIREGTLPAAKIGNRLLVKEADVDALIAGSQVGSRRAYAVGGLRELERSGYEKRQS